MSPQSPLSAIFQRLARFAPVRDPKPVPPAAVTDDPLICIRINRSYLPYILGVLEVWAWDDIWEGSETEKQFAIGQFEELKLMLMTATDDCGDDDMACSCGNNECICDALNAIAEALATSAAVQVINSEIPVPGPLEELPEAIGMPEEGQTAQDALNALCYAIARFLNWAGNMIDGLARSAGITSGVVAVILTAVLFFFNPIVGLAAGLVFGVGAGAIAVLSGAFMTAAGNAEAWKDIACAMYKALHGAPMSPGGIEFSIHNTRGNLQTEDGVLLWDGIVTLCAPARGFGLAGIAACFISIYNGTLEMIESSSPLLSDEDCQSCKTCCNRWDFRLSSQTWIQGNFGEYQQGHGLKSLRVLTPEDAARMDWSYECAEEGEGRYWGMEVTYTVTAYFADRGFTTGPSIRLKNAEGTVVTEVFLPVGKLSEPLTGVRTISPTSTGEVFFSSLQVFQNSQANLSSDRTEVTIHTIELFCEEQE